MFFLECDPVEITNIVYFLKVYIYNPIKIIAPILVIVMGSIDLVKAMIAQDDKQIKAGFSMFIKRLVIAVCVFLVFWFVNWVVVQFGQDNFSTCWKSVGGQ